MKANFYDLRVLIENEPCLEGSMFEELGFQKSLRVLMVAIFHPYRAIHSAFDGTVKSIKKLAEQCVVDDDGLDLNEVFDVYCSDVIEELPYYGKYALITNPIQTLKYSLNPISTARYASELARQTLLERITEMRYDQFDEEF